MIDIALAFIFAADDARSTHQCQYEAHTAVAVLYARRNDVEPSHFHYEGEDGDSVDDKRIQAAVAKAWTWEGSVEQLWHEVYRACVGVKHQQTRGGGVGPIAGA